jgi:hypothetical protein
MADIYETDCVFRAFDGDAGSAGAITIEPRAGGWTMRLHLRPELISAEEATELAHRLHKVVRSVTAEPTDPFTWVEAPSSGTKQ